MSDPTQARDERMMREAIAAAYLGDTSPNPRVGAVVARADEIISVGFHEKAGAPHAEVDAITKAAGDTEGATLYVTLEPCNHHGRTPPCTDAVIEAGFARVVVAHRDIVPHVPGSEAKLREAGIDVSYGVLKDEAEALVSSFFKHVRTGLPYVTIKAAVTLDGRVATRTGDSKWITGEESRTEAHRMRADADAIMVGVETVLADDPRLDVRLAEGRDPLRVVLDTHLRTPSDANVVTGGGCMIFHGPDADDERREVLASAGASLIGVDTDEQGHVDLEEVLYALGAQDVVRLMVEGGGRVHGALLDAGFADEAAIFISPRIVGDREARGFAAGRGVDRIADGWRILPSRVRTLGSDILVTGALVRDPNPS